MLFFKKGEFVYKNPSQINISESMKSGRERPIFLRDSYKNNFQFTTEPKISHRLLGGSLEVPTKYYVNIKIM